MKVSPSEQRAPRQWPSQPATGAVGPTAAPGIGASWVGSISSKTQGRDTWHNGAPPLPDMEGEQVAPKLMYAVVADWLGYSAASLQSDAMDVLADLQASRMATSGSIMNIAAKNLYSAQRAVASTQTDKVRGDRRSAALKVAGSVLGLGVALCVGKSLAASVADLTTRLTDLLDKRCAAGGAFIAQEADLRRSSLDLLVNANRSTQDIINNAYEQGRKDLQSTFDRFRQMADKYDQNILQIASNV